MQIRKTMFIILLATLSVSGCVNTTTYSSSIDDNPNTITVGKGKKQKPASSPGIPLY